MTADSLSTTPGGRKAPAPRLLDLVAAVAHAYSPSPGVVLDVDDAALAPLLDAAAALHDWCMDCHPDWQG